MELQNTSIMSELSSSNADRQINGLLGILSQGAQGRDVSDYITVVTERAFAEKANRTVRKFGYLFLRYCLSSLVGDSWNSVERAINADLAPDKENTEVALYALRTLCCLPKERLSAYVTKYIKSVETLLKHTNYRMRETATLLLHGLMAPPRLLGGGLAETNAHCAKALQAPFGTWLVQQALDPADNVAAAAFSVLKALCNPTPALYCHQQLVVPVRVPGPLVQMMLQGEILHKLTCRMQCMAALYRVDALRAVTLLSLASSPTTGDTIVREVCLPLLLSASLAVPLLVEACHSTLLVALSVPDSCKQAVTVVVQYYLDTLWKGGDHLAEATILQYARETALALPLVPVAQQLSCALRFLHTPKRIIGLLSASGAEELQILTCSSSFRMLFQPGQMDRISHLLQHDVFTSYLWEVPTVRERVVCTMSEVLLDVTNVNILILVTKKIAECLLWTPDSTAMFYSYGLRLLCHVAAICSAHKDPTFLKTFLQDVAQYAHVGNVGLILAQYGRLDDTSLGDTILAAGGEARHLWECRQKGQVITINTSASPTYFSFLSANDYVWLQRYHSVMLNVILNEFRHSIAPNRRVHSVMITGPSDAVRVLATYVMVPGSPLIELNLALTNATTISIPRAVVVTGCMGDIRPFAQLSSSAFSSTFDASRMIPPKVTAQSLGIGRYQINNLEPEETINVSTTFVIDALHYLNAFTVTIDVATSGAAAKEDDRDDDFEFADDSSANVQSARVTATPIVIELLHYFDPRDASAPSLISTSKTLAFVVKAMPFSFRGMTNSFGCSSEGVLKRISEQMQCSHFVATSRMVAGGSFLAEFLGRLTSLDGGPTDFFVFLFQGSSLSDGTVSVEWDIRAKSQAVVSAVTKHPQFRAWMTTCVAGAQTTPIPAKADKSIAVTDADVERDALKEWKAMKYATKANTSAANRSGAGAGTAREQPKVPLPSFLPSPQSGGSPRPQTVPKPKALNPIDDLFS